MTDSKRFFSSAAPILIRLGICVCVLAIGMFGMLKLASLKTPPRPAQDEERSLEVEVIEVQPVTVPVIMTGYGQVIPLNTLDLSPEVSGRVVEAHPQLDPGEIIPEGEILFRIDDTNYRAAALQAKAEVQQMIQQIRRLKEQLRLDTKRLETLERNRDLARAEFERYKTLFKKGNVESKSGVERAEQAANAAEDQVDQLDQSLSITAIRIQEAEHGLTSARARQDLARADLERCTVRTPFRARVTSADIEVGQVVSPGRNVVTLADDSILEIHVPLDSREARKWLLFNGVAAGSSSAWFENLTQVECTIHWTEDSNGHTWTGHLNRVVRFEPQTRTLTLAVRVRGPEAHSRSIDRLPLVEGMFCSVSIPGRTLEGVFELPRAAVDFEGTVFTAVNSRLKTVPVTTARIQGEKAYVSQGLEPGDLVVTTRLVDPIENSLLSFDHPGGGPS